MVIPRAGRLLRRAPVLAALLLLGCASPDTTDPETWRTIDLISLGLISLAFGTAAILVYSNNRK